MNTRERGRVDRTIIKEGGSVRRRGEQQL